MKENQLKTKKIILFIVINTILLILLYNIPITNNLILENICIYKLLFKTECFNCGMTRAFLSILHGDFFNAINYNLGCIFVFPLVVFAYLFSWYKYINKNNI